MGPEEGGTCQHSSRSRSPIPGEGSARFHSSDLMCRFSHPAGSCAHSVFSSMPGTAGPHCAPAGPLEARGELRRRPSWAVLGEAQRSAWSGPICGTGNGAQPRASQTSPAKCFFASVWTPMRTCLIVPLYYNAHYFLTPTG